MYNSDFLEWSPRLQWVWDRTDSSPHGPRPASRPSCCLVVVLGNGGFSSRNLLLQLGYTVTNSSSEALFGDSNMLHGVKPQLLSVIPSIPRLQLRVHLPSGLYYPLTMTSLHNPFQYYEGESYTLPSSTASIRYSLGLLRTTASMCWAQGNYPRFMSLGDAGLFLITTYFSAVAHQDHCPSEANISAQWFWSLFNHCQSYNPSHQNHRYLKHKVSNSANRILNGLCTFLLKLRKPPPVGYAAPSIIFKVPTTFIKLWPLSGFFSPKSQGPSTTLPQIWSGLSQHRCLTLITPNTS